MTVSPISLSLSVTQYGKNVLYHKNGKGTFTDVTDKAGVGGLRVVTGKMSQIREIAGGGGYLSQNDLGTNSGLGKTKRAEIVEIT